MGSVNRSLSGIETGEILNAEAGKNPELFISAMHALAADPRFRWVAPHGKSQTGLIRPIRRGKRHVLGVRLPRRWIGDGPGFTARRSWLPGLRNGPSTMRPWSASERRSFSRSGFGVGSRTLKTLAQIAHTFTLIPSGSLSTCLKRPWLGCGQGAPWMLSRRRTGQGREIRARIG